MSETYRTLGTIFPEGIVKGRKRRKILKGIDGEKISSLYGRFLFFVLLLVFGLGTIFARFFTLVVIEGEQYQKLASGNRIKELKITAPRGIIYDRNQVALVRNIPVFVSDDGDRYFEEKPSLVSAGLREDVARNYIFGDLTAHIIGYTGEVDEENMTENAEYKAGDIVGKSGIEEEYDRILRGKDGKELIEVDALGQTVRTLGKIPPNVGNNLTLTVDIELQKAIKEAFADKKGAVIVEDPNTGEILGLYSSPSFDSNKLIRGEDVEAIFADSRQPLFNRAIAGQYPPGSTFKILTALAALETGAISKDTRIEDTGVLTVGKFSFGNWYFSQYGKKEGFLDIVGAIRRSNDIFFYKIGEAIGIERLADWVRKAGLGSPTGIDIPGEEKGLMPDPSWQREMKGEDWYLGNTYHIAIGQGDILATPLQVNSWTDIIANNGKLCRPHVVRSLPVRQAGQKSDVRSQDELCKDLNINKENIALVKEGMRQACNQGGTGFPLFNFKVPATTSDSTGKRSLKFKIDGVDFLEPTEASFSAKNWVEIPVACKTGTAEFGETKGKTHAWFTMFAPVIHPQVSITVLVEGGGEGSSVAAPIAKKILEKWFSM